MIVALDYDKTYTLDPVMWDAFIDLLKERGHSVVCATMRFPSEAIEMPCNVIYTSRQPKRDCLAQSGVFPDIWIDDTPEFIFMGAH